MRVVKSGITKWQPTGEKTCPSCQAVLEIERADLRYDTYMDSDQRGDTWKATKYGFSCPECGYFNVVKDIPIVVQKRIPRLGSIVDGGGDSPPSLGDDLSRVTS
jgi:acetone carboxylase gamma subunit